MLEVRSGEELGLPRAHSEDARGGSGSELIPKCACPQPLKFYCELAIFTEVCTYSVA